MANFQKYELWRKDNLVISGISSNDEILLSHNSFNVAIDTAIGFL